MIRAAIVGATGYTGAELVRLLSLHPEAELTLAMGRSRAGEPIDAVLPSLTGLRSDVVEAFDADRVCEAADVAFCGLPHGTSAPIVAALRKRGLRVFDLSADFRLNDLETYTAWYGDHGAKALFGSAVYGLPELYREALRTADLVAVPGCYPTASLLAVSPAVAEGLVDTSGPLVIDAKSGVSGAGRSAKPRTHFSETSEAFRAYAVGGQHRHTPEIEQ
ncbi:MAG: N-acetyl-gamma-glutamyl-phosphate reductase, partial [Sandaracinaceae bacterium]